jgi:hypothetical protein
MPANQVRHIMDLLGLEEIPKGNILEYQALEIEGQSVIHVVMGKEFLAYIWLLMDVEKIELAMTQLLETGQDERSTRKAQGFKLVIATPDPSAVEFSAHRVFKDYGQREGSTELHITRLSS